MREKNDSLITGELSVSADLSEDFALCDAIRNAADSAVDKDGVTGKILQRHLLQLCNLQYAKLSGLSK